MGQFRVEVTAVGGHGCQREVKDGGTVHGCKLMTCPDCLTAEYVQKMRLSGANVESATLTHWPGQPSEVVDVFDLKDRPGYSPVAPRTRKGSF